MCKILLVDDEPLMRVALSSMLDYEAYGFEICATATNGKEALRLIEQYHPEIVITDLKMPVMDGIELIREIQAKKLGSKVLVISNYSDFDLVREALKLGAIDYLLKIDMQEMDLLKQLEILHTLIQKEQESHEQQQKQIHYVNIQQKKILLRDFFSSSETNVSIFLDHADFPLHFIDTPCNLFYIIPGGETPNSQCWIDFSIIENILAEALRQAELTMEMFTLFPTGMVMLTPVAHCALAEFSNQLQKILQTYVSSPCTIIYSKSFTGYTQAKEEFEHCKAASNLLFYFEREIISSEEIKFQLEEDKPSAIIFATYLAKLGAVEGYTSVQDLVKSRLDDCCNGLIFPDSVRRYAVNVSDYLLTSTPNHQEFSSGQIKDILEKMTESPNISALKKIVFELIEKLFPPAGVRKEVLAILEYIDENYQQKLTLSEIAEHVYLNESYICRIFKEDMNTSIINYINTVRMEKAALIIEKGKTPIKSICFLVGIETPSYFYRLFKAHFGMSPVQYAKKNNLSI